MFTLTNTTAAATGPGPFFIGIAGGTASGKTSVCAKIIEELGQANVLAEDRKVVRIVQDNFYRKLNRVENKQARDGTFNFDHPTSIDFGMMKSVLNDLAHNRITHVPIYDFVTNSPKLNQFEMIYPADVVLVEGILAFYDDEIRNMFHLKVFVETDSDIRLARRIERDVKERGRALEHILTQYLDTVKPSFEEFCLPTKKYADIIVPRGVDNSVAMNVLVLHIKQVLVSRSDENQSSENELVPTEEIHDGGGVIAGTGMVVHLSTNGGGGGAPPERRNYGLH